MRVLHSCTCPAGFEGDRCETNINDCQTHGCQNNATCIDLVDHYSCNCPAAFTGENEIVIRKKLIIFVLELVTMATLFENKLACKF